jgi:hypothetical protein
MKILDATAGYRAMWKGRSPSDILFLDRRAEVRPNIVADDRALPFAPQCFGIIYFDPPFLHGRGGWSREKFGGFGTYDQLRELFRVASREFARILIPGGLLIVKLMRSSSAPSHHTSHFMQHVDLRFAEYASCAGFRLVKRWQRNSKGGTRKCQVVWMTFSLVGGDLSHGKA